MRQTAVSLLVTVATTLLILCLVESYAPSNGRAIGVFIIFIIIVFVTPMIFLRCLRPRSTPSQGLEQVHGEDQPPSYEAVIAKPTLYCLLPHSDPSTDVTTAVTTPTLGHASVRLSTESHSTERAESPPMRVMLSYTDDAPPSYEAVRDTWPYDDIPILHELRPTVPFPIMTQHTSFPPPPPSHSIRTCTDASVPSDNGPSTTVSSAQRPS